MTQLAILKWAISALACVAIIGGAYAFGRSDGRAIEVAKQSAVEQAVRDERARREAGVQAADATGAAREIERSEQTREIRHEIERIVERPVYRDVCIDPDGVRALDRASAVANGHHPGAPAGDAADGADGSAIG